MPAYALDRLLSLPEWERIVEFLREQEGYRMEAVLFATDRERSLVERGWVEAIRFFRDEMPRLLFEREGVFKYAQETQG